MPPWSWLLHPGVFRSLALPRALQLQSPLPRFPPDPHLEGKEPRTLWKCCASGSPEGGGGKGSRPPLAPPPKKKPGQPLLVYSGVIAGVRKAQGGKCRCKCSLRGGASLPQPRFTWKGGKEGVRILGAERKARPKGKAALPLLLSPRRGAPRSPRGFRIGAPPGAPPPGWAGTGPSWLATKQAQLTRTITAPVVQLLPFTGILIGGGSTGSAVKKSRWWPQFCSRSTAPFLGCGCHLDSFDLLQDS